MTYLRKKLEKETELKNKEIELRQAERNKQMERQQNRVADRGLKGIQCSYTESIPATTESATVFAGNHPGTTATD